MLQITLLGWQKQSQEKGGPNPKPRKILATETVHSFNERDEVSRVMPGMKDCVKVTEPNGNKGKKSKRLIFSYLQTFQG